jgi:hypothetical protein
MCSKEEVQSIVDEQSKHFDDKLYRSHNSVAAGLSDLGAQVSRLSNEFEKHRQAFIEHDLKEIAYNERVDKLMDNINKIDFEAVAVLVKNFKDSEGFKNTIVGWRGTLLGVVTVGTAGYTLINWFISTIKSIR